MDRFIKLARAEDSELLQHMIQHDHNAFILLTVIAQRARRVRNHHPASGRKQFEAEIGDYRACGLSEQNYRTAKKHLEKWGLVTIKPTSKGTIATLLNGSVFDINPEDANEPDNRQQTDGQRTGNGRPTTKKNDKKEKNGENGRNESSASGDASSADSPSDSYYGLTGRRLERFNEFWGAFDYKQGKAGAARAWKELGSISDVLFQQILAGAKCEAAGRRAHTAKGLTPKMAQGWLTDRRWEDEPESKKEEVQRKEKTRARLHPALREEYSRPTRFEGT